MLRVRNLSRSFLDPGRGRVAAVAGLSFEVRPGEVYGLLGPNGAGKTTTLRLLATLLRPDAGEIVVQGVDATADPVGARSKLAYVPAEAGLPRELRVIEAVTLFGAVQGVAKSREKADQLLDALGASSFKSSPCGGLSTGQKRRVVLARALMHDPPVMLLDEPTDGLDVGGRREVLALIRRLAGEGRAMLLSSHVMGEVEAVCDRAGVMAGGRLVAEGTLAELRAVAGEADLSTAFLKLVEGAALAP